MRYGDLASTVSRLTSHMPSEPLSPPLAAPQLAVGGLMAHNLSPFGQPASDMGEAKDFVYHQDPHELTGLVAQ